MTLLELRGVVKRYRDGELERAVLREVSLRLDAGELAMVWGVRGAGRSTLLRVAAGIEPPDEGVVRFESRELSGRGEDALGAGIGYCQRIPDAGSQLALEAVTMPLLASGVSSSQARIRASGALERAGAADCASRRVAGLDTAEAVRVALARVLAHEPRLVVIDDPIQGVDLLERDGILALLRSLTGDGIAVLASTTDATGLAGADRTLTLSDGELRGPPQRQLAPVLALRRPLGRRASA